MAPHNQYPQNNGPPPNGSVGRGGYNNTNGSRGKKGRGGYSNNNSNGYGNASSGGDNYNNSNNNWRAPSYGSQNYGPRAVPNVQPQGPPAPWGAHYGSGYPIPQGNMGGYIAPATTNSHTAATIYQPSDVARKQDVTPTSTTPIATSVQTVVDPSPHFTPSRLITNFDDLKASPTQKATSDAGDNSRTNLEEPKRSPAVKLADDNGLSEKTTLFTPVLANAPQQPGKPLLVSQRPILHGCVPKEELRLPIDELHQKTQDLFEGICQAPLKNLKTLEKSFAERLQLALIDTRGAHQAQEAANQEQRSRLLGQLLAARESELQQDQYVRHCYHRFMDRMTEAGKQVGDSKNATQLHAIKHLKAATMASDLATKQRSVIEECRYKLLCLENIRVMSANTYAETVQNVVSKVLDHLIKDASASSKPEGSDGTASAKPQTRSAVTKTSMDEETLPVSSQQVVQQSVFERHPELKHQSIDEVLDHIDTTEVRVGLKVTTPKEQLQAQEKSNAIPTTSGQADAKHKKRGNSAGPRSAMNDSQAPQTKPATEPSEKKYEHELHATDVDCSMPNSDKKTTAAMVTVTRAAEGGHPLGDKQKLKASLAADSKAETGMKDKRKATINVENGTKEETTTNKAKEPPAGLTAGQTPKRKNKNKNKKTASTDNNAAGSSTPGGNNGSSSAGNAPVDNEIRKGG